MAESYRGWEPSCDFIGPLAADLLGSEWRAA
jgi:hypothetical protein